MNTEKQWQMVLARDAGSDGKFVYAVRSTGIFAVLRAPAGVLGANWWSSTQLQPMLSVRGIVPACGAGLMDRIRSSVRSWPRAV